MNSNRATKYFHHVILILFNKTVINCIRGTQIQIDYFKCGENQKNLNIPLTHVQRKIEISEKGKYEKLTCLVKKEKNEFIN